MFRRLCSRRKRTTARIVTDGSETLCVATQIVGCGAGVPSRWAAAGRLGSRYPVTPLRRLSHPPTHSQTQLARMPANHHPSQSISTANSPSPCQSLSESWLMPRAHHGGLGLAAIWHGTPTVSYNLQSYSPTVLQSYRPVLPTTYNPASKTGMH